MGHTAFSAPGRFWKGNLHTHSNRSDGVKSPEEVCAIYRDAGYDFLSLTDHFLRRYGSPIVDTRGFRTNRFTTILGAEVHAPRTSHGELWHLLAVGLPTDFAPRTSSETATALAQRCLDAGAFLALAHPAWYGLTAEDAAAIPGAHAVEIYNHTSQVIEDRGDGSYLLDQLLAQGRRLTACATDDAHFKHPDWFGGWVMVKAPVLEAEALVEALKSGAYYSSQGPLIHDISVGGGHIEIACSPVKSICVLGRASKAQPLLGHHLTRARLPLETFAGDWCRVVVVDEAGKRAWSNPIWLDGAAST